MMNNEARRVLLDGIYLSNGTPIIDIADRLDTPSHYRQISLPYDSISQKQELRGPQEIHWETTYQDCI